MKINLPNIITLIRILIVPLFVIYLQKHMIAQALVVFTIAGISDGLDGFFARCLNQRTTMGAYLDPVADKLLLITAFVTLAILKLLPDWLAVIVISRDILIVLGVLVFSILNTHYEVKPSILSKCTTFIQLLTVFCTLLHQIMPQLGIGNHFLLLYGITAVATILSGLHYIYIGLNTPMEPPQA